MYLANEHPLRLRFPITHKDTFIALYNKELLEWGGKHTYLSKMYFTPRNEFHPIWGEKKKKRKSTLDYSFKFFPQL